MCVQMMIYEPTNQCLRGGESGVEAIVAMYNNYIVAYEYT